MSTSVYLGRTGSMATKRKAKRRRRCACCKKLKRDVRRRPNYYDRDVHDDSKAEWVACDNCARENLADI